MGLPGSGKTTLAKRMQELLSLDNKTVTWLNADRVRKEYDDWDFSKAGRIRQSKRMYELSTRIDCDYVIADFVAPLTEMRNIFKADWTIWMDTIFKCSYDDTNVIFEKPEVCDFHITEQDVEKWANLIAKHIKESD